MEKQDKKFPGGKLGTDKVQNTEKLTQKSMKYGFFEVPKFNWYQQFCFWLYWVYSY